MTPTTKETAGKVGRQLSGMMRHAGLELFSLEYPYPRSIAALSEHGLYQACASWLFACRKFNVEGGGYDTHRRVELFDVLGNFDEHLARMMSCATTADMTGWSVWDLLYRRDEIQYAEANNAIFDAMDDLIAPSICCEIWSRKMLQESVQRGHGFPEWWINSEPAT